MDVAFNFDSGFTQNVILRSPFFEATISALVNLFLESFRGMQLMGILF